MLLAAVFAGTTCSAQLQSIEPFFAYEAGRLESVQREPGAIVGSLVQAPGSGSSLQHVFGLGIQMMLGLGNEQLTLQPQIGAALATGTFTSETYTSTGLSISAATGAPAIAQNRFLVESSEVQLRAALALRLRLAPWLSAFAGPAVGYRMFESIVLREQIQQPSDAVFRSSNQSERLLATGNRLSSWPWRLGGVVGVATEWRPTPGLTIHPALYGRLDVESYIKGDGLAGFSAGTSIGVRIGSTGNSVAVQPVPSGAAPARPELFAVADGDVWFDTVALSAVHEEHWLYVIGGERGAEGARRLRSALPTTEPPAIRSALQMAVGVIDTATEAIAVAHHALAALPEVRLGARMPGTLAARNLPVRMRITPGGFDSVFTLPGNTSAELVLGAGRLSMDGAGRSGLVVTLQLLDTSMHDQPSGIGGTDSLVLKIDASSTRRAVTRTYLLWQQGDGDDSHRKSIRALLEHARGEMGHDAGITLLMPVPTAAAPISHLGRRVLDELLGSTDATLHSSVTIRRVVAPDADSSAAEDTVDVVLLVIREERR